MTLLRNFKLNQNDHSWSIKTAGHRSEGLLAVCLIRIMLLVMYMYMSGIFVFLLFFFKFVCIKKS